MSARAATRAPMLLTWLAGRRDGPSDMAMDDWRPPRGWERSPEVGLMWGVIHERGRGDAHGLMGPVRDAIAVVGLMMSRTRLVVDARCRSDVDRGCGMILRGKKKTRLKPFRSESRENGTSVPRPAGARPRLGDGD